MPQKGITMKMKAGVNLGHQFAVQADRFLETIDESCSPVAGSQMIIREEVAAESATYGPCMAYLC
jgi:hypothetical protein